MPATQNAGQLATVIRQMCIMDIEELGPDEDTQNDYIYRYMSQALRELASLAFVVRVSDALAIASDGYVTFKRSTLDIDDLYEPLRILDSNNTEINKRTSFSAPKGWWRESANTQLHVKGLTSGNYTLHYKGYPATVTLASDVPEFPPSAYMVLCYWAAGLIKESKSRYEHRDAMFAQAKQRMKIAVLANEDGRGRSSGGAVPSVNIVDMYFPG